MKQFQCCQDGCELSRLPISKEEAASFRMRCKKCASILQLFGYKSRMRLKYQSAAPSKVEESIVSRCDVILL